MKVAVIGRGSAGSLAAASVSRQLPGVELSHIYNSSIPVIGVGEGSLPGLPFMLQRITGLPEEKVRERLSGTFKYGIQYESWGRTNREFFAHFQPPRVGYGYHLSAETLVELLDEHIDGERIDGNVVRLTSHGTSAEIEMEGGESCEYDLVFDARGFPKVLDPKEHLEIPFIPTNAAVIRRAPAGDFIPATRAVARPHGWMFVIPLQIHTSYGYIFNRQISRLEDVEADFDQFMNEEGKSFEQRAVIDFPNFVSRRVYDGAVARIGNAGGFMEPLEATALGMIERQIAVILEKRFSRPSEWVERDAEVINRHLIHWAWRYGAFIAWHYAEGSAYDTPFWRYAQDEAWPRCFSPPEESGLDLAGQLRILGRYLDAGLRVSRGEEVEMKAPAMYSGFPVQNFAEVARGLSWNGTLPSEIS